VQAVSSNDSKEEPPTAASPGESTEGEQVDEELHDELPAAEEEHLSDGIDAQASIDDGTETSEEDDQPESEQPAKESDDLDQTDEADEEVVEQAPDADEDYTGASDEEEDDEEIDELAIVEAALRRPEATRGLRDHLSSERSRRTDANSRQKVPRAAQRLKQNEGRAMTFWVTHENGMFNARMSAKKFSDLPPSERLILSVILVRSAKFASIFNTEEKIQNYLLSVVNKNKEKTDPAYIDESKLDDLIKEVVKGGFLVLDELGPQLTPDGIKLLESKKKSKHWW
jgi:hypothetical protein